MVGSFARLLRTRRERPCRCAAERDNELSSSDVACHVTLPWGSCNGRDDITPGRAALRDFKPAYDCSGVKSGKALNEGMFSASPKRTYDLGVSEYTPWFTRRLPRRLDLIPVG